MAEYAFQVDTNVLLDFYSGNRDGSPQSVEFVNACMMRGVSMLVACHQLKDLYYGVQGAMKREARMLHGTLSPSNAIIAREAAWGSVENAMESFDVVGADVSDAWLAVRYCNLHPDFEDNLVIAAAVRGKATHLVTNDQQLLRNTARSASMVHAVTPEEAIALLAAA